MSNFQQQNEGKCVGVDLAFLHLDGAVCVCISISLPSANLTRWCLGVHPVLTLALKCALMLEFYATILKLANIDWNGGSQVVLYVTRRIHMH